MVFEILAVCLAHGLTSWLVHGLPAFREASLELNRKGIQTYPIVFSVIWIFTYSLTSMFTCGRLFESKEMWIQTYKRMLIEAHKD
jgi:hypothetical protein